MASPIPQSSVRPPQKRARVEEELNERAEFSRNTEFWFSDGTIVLMAVKNLIAFRVHKGILSMHSPIFRDMFSVPQPDTLKADDAIEGCAVVDLHDSSSDILLLLRVLYDPRRRYEGVSFEIVVPILKMSDKYEIDALRKDALQCMYAFYPHSFIIWESQYGASNTKEAPGSTRPHLLSDASDAETLNLARLIGEPSLIPAAFYWCCIDVTEALVDHAKYKSLSEDDLRRCIDARTRLVHEAHCIAHAVLTAGPSDLCMDGLKCERTLKQQYVEFQAVHSDCDALNSWRWKINTLLSKGELCPSCAETCKKKDAEVRGDLWKRLPQIFDVEEEVKDWSVDTIVPEDE